MSPRRHVFRELPAYCEGALSESECERIRGHLAGCARCRRLADEIAAGDSLARRLTPVSLPSHRSEAIRRSLVEGLSARADTKRRGAFAMAWKLGARPPNVLLRAGDSLAASGMLDKPLVRRSSATPPRGFSALPLSLRPRRTRDGHYSNRLLAAALAVVLGFLWFALARRPNVQVERASAPAAEFEELALALHAGLASGRARLEVETSSVPEVKSWLREHAGLSASLAASRPPEEQGRYLLRGATAVPGDGFTAAAIAYSVGGRPVTLLTAREEDAPDSPRWGLLGKRVRYRVDSRTGSKTLTWTNSGQAYALVSDLPQMGQRACLVCHTDPGRRRTIESLGKSFPR